jgi:DNA-binding FrmR family transcriptional regulator
MHEKELSKLNRISGQIDGVKKMIAEHRYCPDIIIQLRAIRAAIKAVEANVLENHLKSCVAESLASGNAKDAQKKIDELKDIFKRFDPE